MYTSSGKGWQGELFQKDLKLKTKIFKFFNQLRQVTS
jgi:hypothetical protein